MDLSFIRANPVDAGWDAQQRRDLQAQQASDLREQRQQRRETSQALSRVFAEQPAAAAGQVATPSPAGQPAPGGQAATPSTPAPAAAPIDPLDDMIRRTGDALRLPGMDVDTRTRLMSQYASLVTQRETRNDRRNNEPLVPVLDDNGQPAMMRRSEAAGRRPAPHSGTEPLVSVMSEDGQSTELVPRSQAAGRRAAPRNGTGQPSAGPFVGNSMDAQSRNILINGDPNTAAYAAAYQHLSRPHRTMVPVDPNNPGAGLQEAWVYPDLSQSYRAPTYRPGQAAPTEESTAPAAPTAPTGATPSGAPTAPAQPTPTGSPPAAPGQTPGAIPIPGTGRPAPAAAEHVRQFQNESQRVIDALDNFERLANSATGAERFRAWLGDPTDPRVAQIQQAYNNMVVTLRAPAFLNTGVLQPAEMEMIRTMLRDPTSWRGALATPEARSAQLNEIRRMIRDGIAAQRSSIGQGAAPAPTTQPTGTPSRMRFDSQGHPVPGPRSDAGGQPEQVAQAPGARALLNGSMVDAGQASLEQQGVDSQWNSGGVMTGPGGRPVTPGTRDNPAVLPSGQPPATGPASDFGDGMGGGDRAQVPPAAAPPASTRRPPIGPSDRYVDTLFRYESGGQANPPPNSMSSARGAGQFLEGTWLGRPDAPGIAARLGVPRELLQAAWAGDPRARQQVLDMRLDPEMARRGTLEYARIAGQSLIQAGLPVNDQTLALAHFLGPAGAARFLRAYAQDPNAPVTANGAVSGPAYRANQGLLARNGQPITRQQLYDLYQQRFGGGAPAQPAGPSLPATMGLSGEPGPTTAVNPAQVATAEPSPAAPPMVGAAPAIESGGAPPQADPRFVLRGGPVAPPLPPMSAMPMPQAPNPGALVQRDLANLATQAPDLMQPDAPPPVAEVPQLPAQMPLPSAGTGAQGMIMSDVNRVQQMRGQPAPVPQPVPVMAAPPGQPQPAPHEQLASDLRSAVSGFTPTRQGPFALTDPATIRQARETFARTGRTEDWNAGIASFLADRFGQAMQEGTTPHDFQRAVWANPRQRAILQAAMTPEQQTAFRDLIRVTDLAHRSPTWNPARSFAVELAAGRNARQLADIITNPAAVAQLKGLSSIPPDSPQALAIVGSVLGQGAAPQTVRNPLAESFLGIRSADAQPGGPQAPMRIRFDASGNRVTE